MRNRSAAWVVVFFALVAAAWFSLRPPEMPVGTDATPAISGGPEARAAAAPTSARLGTAAVLKIDPRGVARSPVPVRAGLWTEYLKSRKYKAIYDRLIHSPEGETAEGRYVLYDIMKNCAIITERTTRQPIVRTTDQKRDQFLASLPETDPQRDKRIAAFDNVATNKCAGLEGLTITQSALGNMLAQAAAAGDPKAQALSLEQSLWAQRRADGNWRSDVAPSDQQVAGGAASRVAVYFSPSRVTRTVRSPGALSVAPSG